MFPLENADCVTLTARIFVPLLSTKRVTATLSCRKFTVYPLTTTEVKMVKMTVSSRGKNYILLLTFKRRSITNRVTAEIDSLFQTFVGL